MGRLRIVAGELKGRRIEVPRNAVVRPTADRVREALFSILGEDVRGARVLDAYAGSGALGFEALSRGAERVVFAEVDRQVAAALERNVERLGVARRSEVRKIGAVELLGGEAFRGSFDLILADPPYAGDEAERFLPRARVGLSGGGKIVIERDSRRPPVRAPEGLILRKSSRYGGTRLDLYGGGS